jgi:DNA-directed RNA polymerase
MLTVTRARASNFDTPLATVHDGFATCAADAPALDVIFKEALVTLYGQGRNPLAQLADQFRQQCPDIPDPPQQGTLDVGQVFLAQPLR